MSEASLVARVAVRDPHEKLRTSPILEAALDVQSEIMRAAAKCAAITQFGAIPARVLDFELLKDKDGIDTIVLHYENLKRPSGEGNYFKLTFGLPHFYSIPNDGSS